MSKDTFISIWGSMAALARAIGEAEVTVRQWFRRGSIPNRYDELLVGAAKEQGHDLTPAHLYELRQDIRSQNEASAAS